MFLRFKKENKRTVRFFNRADIKIEENVLEKLFDESAKLQEVLGEARAMQETFSSRDKNLEKNFKKEFPECSPMIVEQLNKLSK